MNQRFAVGGLLGSAFDINICKEGKVGQREKVVHVVVASEMSVVPRGSSGAGFVLRSQHILKQRAWPFIHSDQI